nr:hypothetical protein [Tanacetum cinerariifolium]
AKGSGVAVGSGCGKRGLTEEW